MTISLYNLLHNAWGQLLLHSKLCKEMAMQMAML